MADLYPFGNSHGDLEISGEDDTIASEYRLSQQIKFFSNKVTFFCPSVNGYLAMEHNYNTYHPEENPLANKAMVAIFLTDVDTRPKGQAGSVWYREDKSPDLLARAAKEIKESRLSKYFEPTLLIISTWDRVGYFSERYDKVNTFQIVVASNGEETHVMLRYSRIEWSSPNNKNGKNGRLEGSDTSKLPLAGVSDGHGRQEMVGSQSSESAILNLARNYGNTGKPGLWIFTTNEPPWDYDTDEEDEDFKSAEQNKLFIDPQLPSIMMSAKKAIKVDMGPEGYTSPEADINDLGLAIYAPPGFIDGKLGLENRAAFGGPYYGVDHDQYDPISPLFLVKETTPPQRFKNDISFTFSTNASIEDLDRKDVFLMTLDPNFDERRKAYRSRLVDGTMGKVEVSREAVKFSVREILNLHVRVVKKVKPTQADFRAKTRFSWTGDADNVVMTGSFSDWQNAKVLEKSEDGSFVTYVDLPIGTYEYKYVVDGVWKHDSKKPSIPDGMGGHNNLIEVTEATFRESCEEMATKEFKKYMRFAATFYNTVVRDVNHVDLLPFSVFSVYPNHPIHINRAKELMTDMIKDIDYKLTDSGLTNPGWTKLQMEDDRIVVANSKLVGWTTLKSVNPSLIDYDSLKKMMEGFDRYVDLKEEKKFLDYKYPSVQIKFRKTGQDGASIKCYLAASGFDKECGTDVDFKMASITVSSDPNLINSLRRVMEQLTSQSQVFSFGSRLGITEAVLVAKRMNADQGIQVDENCGTQMDKLKHFSSLVFSHIEKNSTTLKLNFEKIESTLKEICRNDLLEIIRPFKPPE